ncbi:MAG: metallophosphoesterase family protein, partial [Terriglobia bacterium]
MAASDAPGLFMQVGLVSDTHGYFDPRLAWLLDGVKLILHAGDVGSHAVLDAMGRIAPVRAVRGNVDPSELGLPLSLMIRLGGIQIEMLHILAAPQARMEAWSIARAQAKPGSEPRTRS